MKKLLVGLLVFGSFSSFAKPQSQALPPETIVKVGCYTNTGSKIFEGALKSMSRKWVNTQMSDGTTEIVRGYRVDNGNYVRMTCFHLYTENTEKP